MLQPNGLFVPSTYQAPSGLRVFAQAFPRAGEALPPALVPLRVFWSRLKCHSFVLRVQSLSRVQLFVTQWTVARQAPLSVGIFQARILEWVAISLSRGSSRPRDQTPDSCVSCIVGEFFTAKRSGMPHVECFSLILQRGSGHLPMLLLPLQ